MRIASPPIIGSGYYGGDTPSSEELISNMMSVVEIREYIGSDSLAFLPFDSLTKLLGDYSPNFCYACFSGKYPVEPKEVKVMKRVGSMNAERPVCNGHRLISCAFKSFFFFFCNYT
jgi:amidophosphoribosyltransferase